MKTNQKRIGFRLLKFRESDPNGKQDNLSEGKKVSPLWDQWGINRGWEYKENILIEIGPDEDMDHRMANKNRFFGIFGILITTLALSVGLNFFLFQQGKMYYEQLNALRLDPCG